ncbi:MAG: hypothetical protein M0Q26_15070 [Chitinophagaceae bacterium]|nr:hypothetical protein [Chitinophagaceae bacterium]
MKIKAFFKNGKSSILNGLQKFKLLFFRWKYKIGVFLKKYGGTIVILGISFALSFIMYKKMIGISNKDYDYKKVLEILLTINGVFSAILITYLFNRITWKKDRKLDLLMRA